jgi:hypothetical protein
VSHTCKDVTHGRMPFWWTVMCRSEDDVSPASQFWNESSHDKVSHNQSRVRGKMLIMKMSQSSTHFELVRRLTKSGNPWLRRLQVRLHKRQVGVEGEILSHPIDVVGGLSMRFGEASRCGERRPEFSECSSSATLSSLHTTLTFNRCSVHLRLVPIQPHRRESAHLCQTFDTSGNH